VEAVLSTASRLIPFPKSSRPQNELASLLNSDADIHAARQLVITASQRNRAGHPSDERKMARENLRSAYSKARDM